MKNYTIGIDIGGTNTDAVLVDNAGRIVASHKEITTTPLETAAMRAIEALFKESAVAPDSIEAIFFGTTHATNAILEVKELLGVGLIRIAGHRPDSSPCYFWPKPLRDACLQAYDTIDGGFECHGEPITHFSIDEAAFVIKKQLLQGVEAFGIVGTFSPLNHEQELQVKALIREIAGNDFPVSLSADVGAIGFLERENATLLNASLHKVISVGFATLEMSMQKWGIQAPLYMVQNDGSIMDLEKAMRMPILTIAAGQTNSFIGACKVANLDSSIVIDVGGTSTDIGLVVDGVPLRSCHATKIGGVELQFAMPDVLSLAIGGGSIIDKGNVGPESVSCQLKERALCFGGPTPTFTDIGVLLGILSIPGASKEAIAISPDEAKRVLKRVQEELTCRLTMIQGNKRDLPILIVGGAAPLILATLEGTPFESRATIGPFASVSNAYGAACAEVSATKRCLLSLCQDRDQKLSELKEQTKQAAYLNGAAPDATRIAQVEIIPLAYSKEGLAKVSVTALGPRMRKEFYTN